MNQRPKRRRKQADDGVNITTRRKNVQKLARRHPAQLAAALEAMERDIRVSLRIWRLLAIFGFGAGFALGIVVQMVWVPF